MTFLAAQVIADTLAGGNPVLTPIASGEPEMNLLEMACKGGWIMIVLALMSVITFYIFLPVELFSLIESIVFVSS